MRGWNGFLLAVLLLTLPCALIAAEKSSECATKVWVPVGKSGEIAKEVALSVDSVSLFSEPKIDISMEGAFVSEVSAEDGNVYNRLTIPGCGSTAEEVGLPEMPFKGFFLEIPYGVDISVELLDKKTVSLGASFNVYPLQPPIPNSGDVPPFTINAAAYKMNAFYPATPVKVNDPGFIRGRRVVFIQVFPLQYNPVSREALAFESLSFKLAHKGAIDSSGEERKKRLTTPEFESLGMDLLLNYEPSGAITLAGGGSGGGGPSSGGAADYLIIVADNLSEEIQPLGEWKGKKGFLTKITDMSEIGTTYQDVQDYIQDAYDTWTPAPTYVLLVGDIEDIPSYSVEDSPTDQPYSYLDGTDYYPDVVLARLPVHTETDCTNVVNKILKYDRTPDMGDWYDDYLIAAFFQDFNRDGVAERWFMETAMTIYYFLKDVVGMSGFTSLCPTEWPLPLDPNVYDYHFQDYSYPHRCEINQERWDLTSPDCYPDPVPLEIVNSFLDFMDASEEIGIVLDMGVGLVMHRDHGAKKYWNAPYFDRTYIKHLENGDKTPVVFSINCLTGSFHYTGGDCFAEAFLKKSPGGCSGIVAATNVSYSGWNELLSHGIFDCFWPSYDTTHTNNYYSNSWRPANALNYGKYYMYTYFGHNYYTEYQFKIFHWFGDPEMMLRTETPDILSVTHDTAVYYNRTDSVTVRVLTEGSPVEGALVSITHPSAQDRWKGYTNQNGYVTISNILCTEQGTYDLVVTAHDAYPYEGVINSVSTPDECEEAVTVGEGTVSYALDLPGSTMSSEALPGCASPISGAVDVWYKIRPGLYKHVTVDMFGDIEGSGFVVYSGTCGNMTFVDCCVGDAGVEGATLDFVTDDMVEKDYYIRLYAHPYTSGQLTVNWQNTNNDESIGAKTVSKDSDLYFASDLQSATLSSLSWPGCANPPYGVVDAWYKFQPGPSRHVDIEMFSDLPGSGFVIYSGKYNSLTLIGCSIGDAGEEGALRDFNTAAYEDKVYYLRVYGFSDISGFFNVNWGSPPTGKFCSNPQVAECGDLFDFDNQIPSSGIDLLPCFSSTPNIIGRWLGVNVPPYTASTVHVLDYDLMWHVGIGFYPDCDSILLDSICESDGTVSLTYENPTPDSVPLKALTNSSQYAYHPAISVSCIATNNAACDAVELPFNGSLSGQLTKYATASGSSSCGYNDPAVWYSVDIPILGTEVEATFTHGSSRGTVTLYSGTSCSNLTERSCDYTVGSGPAVCSWNTTMFDQRLWIKVAASYNAAQEISLSCTLPEGASCETAMAAECSDVFDPDNPIPFMGRDVLDCMEGLTEPIGARWLDISIPSKHWLYTTVTDIDLGYNVGVGAYDKCRMIAYTLSENSDVGQVTLRSGNKSPESVDRKILVNHHFSSNAVSTSLVCVPMGESCISPQPVECDDVFNSSNPIPGHGSEVLSCMAGLSYSLYSRWLEMEIPAWSFARFTISDPGYMVGIGFYEECAPISSPLDSMTCGLGEATLTYFNTTEQPVVIQVLMNHRAASPHPEISVTCGDGHWGADCQIPFPVECGFIIDDNAKIPGVCQDKIPCMGQESVYGQWMEMPIPPETTVTVQITIPDTMVGIAFYTTCGNVSSPESSDCGTTSASASYINNGQEPLVVKILVNFSTSAGDFPEIIIYCNP